MVFDFLGELLGTGISQDFFEKESTSPPGFLLHAGRHDPLEAWLVFIHYPIQ